MANLAGWRGAVGEGERRVYASAERHFS